MHYCENCGTRLEDDQIVCPNCGWHNNMNPKDEPTGYINPDGEKAVVPTKNINGFAIAGFVLSFFSPLLGIIFSGIGMSVAPKYKKGYKNLAIAGLAISIVLVLGAILAVGTAI